MTVAIARPSGVNDCGDANSISAEFRIVRGLPESGPEIAIARRSKRIVFDENHPYTTVFPSGEIADASAKSFDWVHDPFAVIRRVLSLANSCSARSPVLQSVVDIERPSGDGLPSKSTAGPFQTRRTSGVTASRATAAPFFAALAGGGALVQAPSVSATEPITNAIDD
jgi:hypothetical protein